jgi:hypothetical protein
MLVMNWCCAILWIALRPSEPGSGLTLSALNGIDILALNHAASRIESGGDLTLQSDGIISGDAHYFSIGDFAILQPITPGSVANFMLAIYDPIIRSAGNVTFRGRLCWHFPISRGRQGSITTQGIEITGPDTWLSNDS